MAIMARQIRPGQIQTGSLYDISASFAVTASHALNLTPPFPYTGDAEITGSLSINGTGGDIFLIKSSSIDVLTVEESGMVTVTNDAPTMFLIRNSSFAPILAVSESGVVIFATQSQELTESAPYGAVYFTSSSFFIGLE